MPRYPISDMPLYLSVMIAKIDEDDRITDAFPDIFGYTDQSAKWLFLVSTALSFQFIEERSDNMIDNDLFGYSAGEFGLSYPVAQALCDVLYDEWKSIKPALTQVKSLEKFLNDIKRSWWDYNKDLECHMYYISKLAEEVIWQISDFTDDSDNDLASDTEFLENGVKKFDNEVIQSLNLALVSTASWIINDSNYGYDHVFEMDLHDVKVLYSLFDLYKYSIYQEPELFERSLQYRASMDEITFDCLLEYKEVHHVLNPCRDQDNYAIEDMLEQMSPSVLARILLNVFFGQTNSNGGTFLHVLATNKPLCFAQLFPHCKEIYFHEDHSRQTPMGLLLGFFSSLDRWLVWSKLSRRIELDLLYELVSACPDYFASLN